jgi:anti-sigma regulatory factor (Ser/Thr protein kinase)
MIPKTRPLNRLAEPTPQQVACLEAMSIFDSAPQPVGTRQLQLTFPSAFVHGDDAVQLLMERLHEWKWVSKRRIDLMTHALHEIIVNAIVHGNKGQTELHVEVELWASGTHFSVHVTDHGHGFSQKDVMRAFQGRRRHLGTGRGIIIMLGIVDRAEYYLAGRCAVLSCRRSDISTDS